MIVFRVNQVFMFCLIISFLKPTVSEISISTEIIKALNDAIRDVFKKEVEKYENKQKKDELNDMILRILGRSPTTGVLVFSDFTETCAAFLTLVSEEVINDTSYVKGGALTQAANKISGTVDGLLNMIKKKKRTDLHEVDAKIIIANDDAFLKKIALKAVNLLKKRNGKLFEEMKTEIIDREEKVKCVTELNEINFSKLDQIVEWINGELE